MKVAVMGTGAIGGYLGAKLAAAGAEVGLIARGAHLDRIRTDGLQVTSPLGDVTVRPAVATSDPAEIGPADVVLFAVKLYDMAEAAEAIRPMVGPDSLVIFLQNGVDAEGVLRAVYEPHQVAGGVALINGALAAPGVIEHRALNDLVVGPLDGQNDARLDAFAAAASEAGINAVLKPDIRGEIWRKFLLLAPMASLSAMTRVRLGKIRAQLTTWALADAGMREVAAVAAAEGVALSEEDIAKTLGFVSGMPETWQASTLIDLEQGKRLEVEWLAGAVCRLADKHGLETPFHRVALGALMPHAAGAG